MGKLKGSLVYLSGLMEAAIDGGCQWREVVTPLLKRFGCGVLNPCAKPNGNPNEEFERRKLANKLKEESKFAELRKLYRPLVQYDLRMVDISSFIFCQLDGTPAVGTYDEIFVAAGQKKPVIIVAPNGYDKLSNWLFGRLDYRLFFPSINSAIEYLDGIDSGSIIPDSNKWRFFNYDEVY